MIHPFNMIRDVLKKSYSGELVIMTATTVPEGLVVVFEERRIESTYAVYNTRAAFLYWDGKHTASLIPHGDMFCQLQPERRKA